ncbi:MAG: NADH:ubiquinone oxidoreductase subunit F (NADH-binding) [Parvicellaceae bacterium]|jgi:NADH:ubiquinone oxidoreductase subunit F (NADH-binding)
MGSKNLSELSGRKGIEDNLFDRMGQLANDGSGAPSVDDLDKLAEEFLMGKAVTYGTTTFYDFLKPENKGKKVYVCNGSACLCAGKQDDVSTELKNHFSEDEIGHMTCLGRCHENAAFNYNGNNYSAKTPDEIADIVTKGEAAVDKYNVGVHGPAILTSEFEGIDRHYTPFKVALKRNSKDVLEDVKNSGIRGRGGAGFPMGLKWEFCRNNESDTKFIICNADEGDPGAYSDRYLLEERPHSVLFGMMIAGYCMHAHHGILYIRGEYPESVKIVEDAVQELRDANLIGKNIDGSGFDFDFKVIKAQGSYICGEETALINSIEGQRPEVRVRPPFPAEQGLFNKPTIVNNVETLAAVHFIMKNGGEEYKKIGTEKSTGTKLVCLDSFFNNPGMYEVEMGTPMSTVVNQLGGGYKEPVKAVHIGGPLGGLVPTEKLDELTLDFESFKNAGFLLGHAGTVCVPETFPMVKYLEHLLEFAAYESCGKCFPCRLGTQRGMEMFRKAQEDSDYKIDKYLLDDLIHTLEVGSLCAHGGGIPLPIKNALEYFNPELSQYIAN